MGPQFRKTNPWRTITWDVDEVEGEAEHGEEEDEVSEALETDEQGQLPEGLETANDIPSSQSESFRASIDSNQDLVTEEAPAGTDIEDEHISDNVDDHMADGQMSDSGHWSENTDIGPYEDNDLLELAESASPVLAAQPLAMENYMADLESDSEDELARSLSPPQTPLRRASPMEVSPTEATAHSASEFFPSSELHGRIDRQSYESDRPDSPSETDGGETEAVTMGGGSDVLPPPLHIALALWCEKSGSSRADYARLREVFQLSRNTGQRDGNKDLDDIETLPLKLDTLKRQVRRHIPLLQLMRKPLKVVVEKQPSLPEQQKDGERQRIERVSWQYWYDPVDLVRTILSAGYLRDKMHFGMAQYVDEPTELWHSQAWGSSIRSTSGDVSYTNTGMLIIPGDIVRIAADPYRIGRVVFIGRDHRSDAMIHGDVAVTLQAVAERSGGRRRQQNILDKFQGLDLSNESELFIVEDILIDIYAHQVIEHLDVRILNLSSSTFRPLRKMTPTRGELEVAHFGREYLENLVKSQDPPSSQGSQLSHSSISYRALPYLLFIDDFGIHRNMYRALKAFYLIPACLEYAERRKLANVFTLSLGPHGAKIDDVVGAFCGPIKDLDAGMHMEINGETTKVSAFVMTFIGDMPQQADNAGILRHTARMGCRSCFCPKEDYGDMTYDIVGQGRYHWDIAFLRKRAARERRTAASKNAFVKETGIRLQLPAVARLAPALDLIQTRAYDAPHSEWRGLGRVLQSLLLTSVLTKGGRTAFLKAFQSYRFPPGWKRIQSPVFYIWSWTLSEAGKASVLTPLILRSEAKLGWFRLPFLESVENTLGHEMSPFRTIIKAFGIIARANTLLGSQRFTSVPELHRHVLASREAYQNLITCAIASHRRHPVDRGGRTNKDLDSSESSGDDGGDKAVGGPKVDGEQQRLPDILEAAVLSSASEASDDEAVDEPLPMGTPARTKFDKLLRLPNVHAGLHLATNAAEFSTVMNSNVLAGELKHKNFKAMADAAAPPNLMGYLFAKDVLQQSLRLGLAGAWEHEHPEMLEALRMLDTCCRTLVQSFLPVGEQDVPDVAETQHDAVGDEGHWQVQMSMRGFVLGRAFNIEANANLMRLPFQHPFIQQLLEAYRTAYEMNVVNLGSKAMRWYRRISYTDISHKRYVHNVGDYVNIAGTSARLLQCFTHLYRRRTYAFLVVRELQPLIIDEEEAIDPVLGLPVFFVGRNERIYGLPILDRQPVYMVPVPDEPDWPEQREYVLNCTWGVDYL